MIDRGPGSIAFIDAAASAAERAPVTVGAR